jgi:hypothetical protein
MPVLIEVVDDPAGAEAVVAGALVDGVLAVAERDLRQRRQVLDERGQDALSYS